MDISEEYHVRCAQSSDISLHLPFLYEQAQGKIVIELGVRSGNSTAAFLAAGADLWSADIDQPQVPGEWHGGWHFLQGNDLSEEVLSWMPEKADIVFIDTWHTYDHCLAELRAYGPRASMVLLHDTQLQGDGEGGADTGEPTGPVSRAITDYCAETGRTWENRPGSYGLGVLT